LIKHINKLREKLEPAFYSPGLRKVAMLFTARSVNSVVTLLFSLVAGRILTIEDHGIFSKAMARIVVAQAIAEIGLQYSLVRFLTPAVLKDNKKQIESIVRASLQLKFYVFLLMLFVCLFWIGAAVFSRELAHYLPSEILPFFHPDTPFMLWVIFLGGFGLSMISYFDAVMVSHDSFFKLSFWLPSLGFIRIFLLFVMIVMERGSIGAEHVAFAFAIGPYLSFPIFFLLFPASFFLVKPVAKDWKPWVGHLLSYNLWIVAASFFSILSDWMEVLLINKPGDTGLYNAARMPMQGFLIMLATMQSILLPRFSRLESKEEFASFFKKVYTYLMPMAVALIPIVWIFAWFIPAWYGAEYLQSVKIFYILYPNFILRLFFAPLGTALFALDQPRIIAIEAFLRMAAGLALNLALIPVYGIIGAAWASLFAQVFGWVFLLYCYNLYFRKGIFPFSTAGQSGHVPGHRA